MDALPQMTATWGLPITAVPKEEQEVLSNASMVLNHLEVRGPFGKYAKGLTVGVEHAYAAHMARYFHKKRDGQWDITVQHPLLKEKMRMTNRVDMRDAWKRAVANNLNYAYLTTDAQEPGEEGVRIYGAATMFPSAQLDSSLGNQRVPFTQSQARVTKNRINFYLITQLERAIGGMFREREVKSWVERYLNELQQDGQIEGYQELDVQSDNAGRFTIRVHIDWAAGAESFDIDTSLPAPEGSTKP
jgi:hypothetical protein